MSGVRLADLAPSRRYKILCGLVVPRPIALVTTIGSSGVVNAAPFSFFNVFSEDPPLVVLGLQHKPDGALKDTTRNIAATGTFVINMVDMALAEAMAVCAVDFPPDMGEPEAAGLTLAPSVDVEPPRLAAAPAALECRRHTSLVFGPGRELLVGEVLRVHARADVMDPATFDVDMKAYDPVGRLFGDLYCRTGDTFALERLTFDTWITRR